MKIGIIDFESLGQDSRVPEKMVLDELGAIVLEFDNFPMLFQQFPLAKLLEILSSQKSQEGILEYTLKALSVSGLTKVGVHAWRFSLLEQIAAGRVIDQSTIKWRGKISGFPENTPFRVYEELERRTDRQNVTSVLASAMDALNGCDAVFCRGTDFDITLLGSACRQWGVRESYRHSAVRDIRTACDELLNDDVYSNMVTPERIAVVIGEDPSAEHQAMQFWIERISELRKTSGHQALVDCVLDLCLYLILKAWRSGRLDLLFAKEDEKEIPV